MVGGSEANGIRLIMQVPKTRDNPWAKSRLQLPWLENDGSSQYASQERRCEFLGLMSEVRASMEALPMPSLCNTAYMII